MAPNDTLALDAVRNLPQPTELRERLAANLRERRLLRRLLQLAEDVPKQLSQTENITP